MWGAACGPSAPVLFIRPLGPFLCEGSAGLPGRSGAVCDSPRTPFRADLRKQARQLENELDLKLVSFSKLCTSSRDGRRDRYRY